MGSTSSPSDSFPMGCSPMGCDIHLFIEVVINDRWECVGELHSTSGHIFVDEAYHGRNYALFSILAGVRGSYEPIIEPRGLPSNISSEVSAEKEGYGNDGHTPHYYLLSELDVDTFRPKSLKAPAFCFAGFSRVIRQMYKIKKIVGCGDDDVRIVFWFDS